MYSNWLYVLHMSCMYLDHYIRYLSLTMDVHGYWFRVDLMVFATYRIDGCPSLSHTRRLWIFLLELNLFFCLLTDPASIGGQKLLHTADINISSCVTSFFRCRVKSEKTGPDRPRDQRQASWFGKCVQNDVKQKSLRLQVLQFAFQLSIMIYYVRSTEIIFLKRVTITED